MGGIAGFHASYHRAGTGIDGGTEWNRPDATERARKAAIAFYEEKLAAGKIKARPIILGKFSGLLNRIGWNQQKAIGNK